MKQLTTISPREFDLLTISVERYHALCLETGPYSYKYATERLLAKFYHLLNQRIIKKYNQPGYKEPTKYILLPITEFKNLVKMGWKKNDEVHDKQLHNYLENKNFETTDNDEVETNARELLEIMKDECGAKFADEQKALEMLIETIKSK